MSESKKFASKFSRQRGTFIKPKKKWLKNSEKYNLHKRSRASLRAGIDLQAAVILPDVCICIYFLYNLHKRSRASLRAGIDLQAAVILPDVCVFV